MTKSAGISPTFDTGSFYSHWPILYKLLQFFSFSQHYLWSTTLGLFPFLSQIEGMLRHILTNFNKHNFLGTCICEYLQIKTFEHTLYVSFLMKYSATKPLSWIVQVTAEVTNSDLKIKRSQHVELSHATISIILHLCMTFRLLTTHDSYWDSDQRHIILHTVYMVLLHFHVYFQHLMKICNGMNKILEYCYYMENISIPFRISEHVV